MFKYARALLSSDANVWKVLLYRFWTIIAGIITVIFVPRYLTAEMQGYYYTFLSVVALQVLFDLGLSQTVAQVSSHEFAHIDLSRSDFGISNVRIGKLAYVKSVVAKWYRWVGGLFIVAVAIFGTAYFSFFGTGFDEVWLGPWIVLVISTGLNLILSPRLAMVEGAGWTGAVANLRLFQSMLGYGLLVVCLIYGGQLWSVAAVPVTANICSLLWLRWTHNPYRSMPAYVLQIHNHAPWRSEILRLQWRVAVAWLGGYFASQTIVPVVFALRGADEAGKIGLGLQIFTAVQALGMSWISARIPLFGQLISRADWTALKTQFVKAAVSATVVSAAFAVAVATVLEGVRFTDLSLAARIPSALAIGALIIISTLNTVIYAMAAYMRAHKEEPLVISSLVIGGMTFVGAVLGGYVSTDAAVGAYAAVTIVINLPWTLLIFRKYYGRDNSSKDCDAGQASVAK